jgi:hypothetical protein
MRAPKRVVGAKKETLHVKHQSIYKAWCATMGRGIPLEYRVGGVSAVLFCPEVRQRFVDGRRTRDLWMSMIDRIQIFSFLKGECLTASHTC